MKKSNLLIPILSLGLICGSIAFVLCGMNINSYQGETIRGAYGIKCDATNNKLNGKQDQANGTGKLKTLEGHDITFNYENVINKNDVWQTIKPNGYFYNIMPINSLIDISVESNSGLSISYGYSKDHYYAKDVELLSNPDVYKFIDLPAYFKIENKTSNPIDIKSIDLSFTCKPSPSGENPDKVIKSIKDAKSHLAEFEKVVDETGIYTSTLDVELKNVQLAMINDSHISKEVYSGKQYKYIFSDGNDYIYACSDASIYKPNKNSGMYKYAADKSSYDIKGKLCYYNGEVEIQLTEMPTWLGDSADRVIDYASFAKASSIENVHKDLQTVPFNMYGGKFSKLVKLNAKCLADDINNNVIIFGDGDYTILGYGHDQITNLVDMGKSYQVIGMMGADYFRNQIIIIDIKSIDEDIIVNPAVDTLTCEELYTYTFDKDDGYHPSSAQNKKYNSLFCKPIKVSGYLNYYVKSSEAYFGIETKYYEKPYETKDAAFDNKLVTFCNERYEGVYKYFENAVSDPVLQYAFMNQKVEITLLPYMMNTDGPHMDGYLLDITPII